MTYPKCLSFTDVVHAFNSGHYRAAGAISLNLVRNALSQANRARRSKWWLR